MPQGERTKRVIPGFSTPTQASPCLCSRVVGKLFPSGVLGRWFSLGLRAPPHRRQKLIE